MFLCLRSYHNHNTAVFWKHAHVTDTRLYPRARQRSANPPRRLLPACPSSLCHLLPMSRCVSVSCLDSVMMSLKMLSSDVNYRPSSFKEYRYFFKQNNGFLELIYKVKANRASSKLTQLFKSAPMAWPRYLVWSWIAQWQQCKLFQPNIFIFCSCKWMYYKFNVIALLILF